MEINELVEVLKNESNPENVAGMARCRLWLCVRVHARRRAKVLSLLYRYIGQRVKRKGFVIREALRVCFVCLFQVFIYDLYEFFFWSCTVNCFYDVTVFVNNESLRNEVNTTV